VASVTAYRYSATITTEAVPQGTDWTNPTYIGADDDNWSTASTTDKDRDTYILKCLNFGFTADDIPEGSPIAGIELIINRYWSYTGEPSTDKVTDLGIYLQYYSGPVGDNKASGSSWPNSEGTATYGGASDTWNASLTQEDVVATTFGVSLKVRLDILDATLCQANVDYLKIRIHYGYDYQPRPLPMASALMV
jgi:hypothetical protein